MRQRQLRWITVTALLAVGALLAGSTTLLIGKTIYTPDVVLRVLQGEQIQGATFAIQTLRFPRMLAAIFAGAAFGMSGSIFQTMLRNPLASPDIIGITSGSSLAAVFCILVLNISGIGVF
ncbi:MAG TPA: iron ABC transporter, partial [Eubacteriaceae bacterium]|nr:iron ABC transporter [Eubacteriaceae bacterium]